MCCAGLALKSPDFAFIQEILSALIAGVIVVVVDWKNSATAAPQNQLHRALAECTRLKICTVGCEALRGVGIKKFAKS